MYGMLDKSIQKAEVRFPTHSKARRIVLITAWRYTGGLAEAPRNAGQV